MEQVLRDLNEIYGELNNSNGQDTYFLTGQVINIVDTLFVVARKMDELEKKLAKVEGYIDRTEARQEDAIRKTL